MGGKIRLQTVTHAVCNSMRWLGKPVRFWSGPGSAVQGYIWSWKGGVRCWGGVITSARNKVPGTTFCPDLDANSSNVSAQGKEAFEFQKFPSPLQRNGGGTGKLIWGSRGFPRRHQPGVRMPPSATLPCPNTSRGVACVRTFNSGGILAGCVATGNNNENTKSGREEIFWFA